MIDEEPGAGKLPTDERRVQLLEPGRGLAALIEVLN